MDDKRFVAIVGCDKYFGAEIFKPGQRVKLVKDLDNPYDGEAIRVELEPVGQVGYVANSVHTVPKGCCSAGRIYDSITQEAFGMVRFVVRSTALLELEKTV